MITSNRIKTDQSLVEFNGSLVEFMQALDLVWLGRKRFRPTEDDPWWKSEEAIGELKQLLENINTVSPRGYRFGPHPEQPLVYGFWKTP